MIATTESHLPDPVLQPDFYTSVPLKRFFAWVADSLLIGLVGVLLIPFTAFTAVFFLPVFYLVVGFLYRAGSIARWSATPGMALMSVELRRADGRPFDGAHAILHTLGYSVSMAFVLPQVISVLLMLTSGRAQGLTDMILGSAAINRPSR